MNKVFKLVISFVVGLILGTLSALVVVSTIGAKIFIIGLICGALFVLKDLFVLLLKKIVANDDGSDA